MKFLAGLALVAFVGLTGCSSKSPTHSPDAVFADPPHLWSGQKVLSQSPEACARKGIEILKALSFIGVVRNGNYVYGTLMANRAAVKCIPNGGSTFVYAAVAGSEREQVERLRNEIVWRL